MNRSERKQLRTNSPPMPAIEQLSVFEHDVTWICPFCCTVLSKNGYRLPDSCPECGQKIERKGLENE